MPTKKPATYLLYLLILGSLAALGPNFYVRYAGGRLLDAQCSEALSEGGVSSEQVFQQNWNYGKADCILVLGAGVYADGTPTPMLRDRLDRGILLYNIGAADKLLLSGDNGQVEYNEVEAMKNYALDAGVPEEDIFLDHAGFSTYESLFRAKAIFQAERIIVVTQYYHEYRALYIGRALGMDVHGVAAEAKAYRGDSAREAREVLARDKDFAKCILKPDPTFLGDAIDIHGDGHLSW